MIIIINRIIYFLLILFKFINDLSFHFFIMIIVFFFFFFFLNYIFYSLDLFYNICTISIQFILYNIIVVIKLLEIQFHKRKCCYFDRR